MTLFDIQPLSIRLNQSGKTLEMEWANEVLSVSHQELRQGCKCADCEQARRAGLSAPVREDVFITDVTAVGAGALRLCFSDGHERGIFPLPYLRQLALTSNG